MAKKIQALLTLFAALLFCSIALAQQPEVNIDKKVHPNLAEAQRLVAQAYNYVEQSQKINKYRLGGNAEKAQQLMIQVNKELKAAAIASNAEAAKKSKH